MSGKVRGMMAKLRGDEARGEFVFQNERTGLPISDIKTGFTGACREAEFVNLTFHDLRHTSATRAAECGVPESVRRDILGHSSPFTRQPRAASAASSISTSSSPTQPATFPEIVLHPVHIRRAATMRSLFHSTPSAGSFVPMLLRVAFVTGLGLSMVADAASIPSSTPARRVGWAQALKAALFFGLFQALMPALGYACGVAFRGWFESLDHWVASGCKILVEHLSS